MVVALIREYREGGTAEAAKQAVAVVIVTLTTTRPMDGGRVGRGCTRSRTHDLFLDAVRQLDLRTEKNDIPQPTGSLVSERERRFNRLYFQKHNAAEAKPT